MLRNRWILWFTLLLVVSGLANLYVVSTRVRRPPTPSAVRLPASARILLQPFRMESLDLTVASDGELNYRVGMQAGATLVYAWSTADKRDTLIYQFSGRETTGASEAHSAFVAQSSGWYRWRWKNRSSHPVAIHLKLTGYYEPATIPSAGMPYDR